jgi:hypothetical protein
MNYDFFLDFNDNDKTQDYLKIRLRTMVACVSPTLMEFMHVPADVMFKAAPPPHH